MDIDDRMHAEADDQSMMPGMDTGDPRTFDPTQGAGTPAWQEAVLRQKELNMKLSANAQRRRN